MAKANVLQKEQLMKTLKRGYPGKNVTFLLTHYDEASDSYEGIAFFDGTIKVKVIGGTMGESIPGFGLTEAVIPATVRVNGLQPYPYHARPDWPWQFVECGDDVQPLIDIADRSAHSIRDNQTQPDAERTPQDIAPVDNASVEVDTGNDQARSTGGDVQTFSPADTNQSGGVDKREAKQHKKRTGEDVAVTEE